VGATSESSRFIEACQARLLEVWNQIAAESAEANAPAPGDDLCAAIRASINSETKTYRYVLPTQVLAKLVDSNLDCRAVQAGAESPGSFDARSVASKVIAPFDQTNERVLGGSGDPYVNNPLRIPAIISAHRQAQKDKPGFDRLCFVLQSVEAAASEEYTQKVFRQVLREVRLRLELVHVTYPFPHRISWEATVDITQAFLSTPSGGDRFEALLAALFEQIGASFGLFADVRRTKSNSADVASGMVADLECVDDQGAIVMAVEAKDRKITIAQLRDKVPLWREAGITEAFVVATEAIKSEDAAAIHETQNVEFVSGHNIYCLSWGSFSSSVFALVGESGRAEFLKRVAAQLDQFSPIKHRRAWAELLRGS